MKKKVTTMIPAVLLLCLSGCSANQGGICAIYGVAALLAAVMLAIYCCTKNKKDPWYILLLCSVLIVNTGYWLLSVSKALSFALWSNRLAYLGSVFLPLSMLMIIFKTARIAYKKWLPVSLLILAGLVFILTATPGWLPIYYKEVSLQVVEGASSLKKVYGPLHSLYLYYLLGYFSAMITAIIYVNVKKRMDNILHAVALTGAVFVNLGVWFIEQLVHIGFEMLALSYIISEMFLLVLDVMIHENQRLKAQIVKQAPPAPAPTKVSKEQLQLFRAGIGTLTQTEKLIFNRYTEGKTTKAIMEELSITENTLKFHNKNIYSKLGINSRKQLLELYRQLSD